MSFFFYIWVTVMHREAQGHIQLQDLQITKLFPESNHQRQPGPQPQQQTPSWRQLTHLLKNKEKADFLHKPIYKLRILFLQLDDLCHKAIWAWFLSHIISHNVVQDFFVVTAVHLWMLHLKSQWLTFSGDKQTKIIFFFHYIIQYLLQQMPDKLHYVCWTLLQDQGCNSENIM